MMHSAPRAAAFAVPALSSTRLSSVPSLPFAARPAQRPARPSFMTRRYETQWLTADGQVDSATRIAPALPEFEEAFAALARGTLVETTKGLVAVEDLEPGMVALTAEGREEVITWIGSMTVFPAGSIAGIAPTSLTRITSDAFGGGRPISDLVLGPQARILVKGARAQAAGHKTAYAPAANLIDGDSIIQVAPVAPMTMYHIVLERQGSLACAGIEVESFHPGKNAAEKFDAQLSQLFLAMFPQIKTYSDFGPLAHARLSVTETESMMAA